MVRDEKGQALIEFTLLLPILVLILGLTIDAGLWMYQANRCQTAANAAAQAGAAQLPDIAAAEAKALEIAEANGAFPKNVTVSADTDKLQVIVRADAEIFFSGKGAGTMRKL